MERDLSEANKEIKEITEVKTKNIDESRQQE